MEVERRRLRGSQVFRLETPRRPRTASRRSASRSLVSTTSLPCSVAAFELVSGEHELVVVFLDRPALSAANMFA